MSLEMVCAPVHAGAFFLTPEALLYSPPFWVGKNILDIFDRKSTQLPNFKMTRCMKTLHIDSFQTLSSEELIAVHGGAGLSSLNATISSLLSDLTLTGAVGVAALSKTLTDLTTNLDAATSGLTGSGGLLGGGLLGGAGSGLLGGGINL